MGVDIVLVLLLTGGFLFGFFRGVVRQALALGALLVIFVASAHLRVPLGEWLAWTSTQFGGEYARMLAFLLIFVGGSFAALALIQFGGSPSNLIRHPVLDHLLGGVAGLVLAAIAIGAVAVILGSYFLAAPPGSAGELGWLRDTHWALESSAVGQLVHDWIVRGLGVALGPLLPPDVRAVMA